MGLCQDVAGIWPADQQDTAQAVCQAESGGNPQAVGDGVSSYGLFQIHAPPAHPDFDVSRFADPAYNAQFALGLWQSSGWGPWSTYASGAFRQYLTGAAGGSSSSVVSFVPPEVPGVLKVIGLLLGLGLAYEAIG